MSEKLDWVKVDSITDDENSFDVVAGAVVDTGYNLAYVNCDRIAIVTLDSVFDASTFEKAECYKEIVKRYMKCGSTAVAIQYMGKDKVLIIDADYTVWEYDKHNGSTYPTEIYISECSEYDIDSGEVDEDLKRILGII